MMYAIINKDNQFYTKSDDSIITFESIEHAKQRILLWQMKDCRIVEITEVPNV